MAVTELPPVFEVEAERPQLAFAPPEPEPSPKPEYDLGMPAYMAAKARRDILGKELPPSGIKDRLPWTKESVIEYGYWLCRILEIDLDNPEGRKLQIAHIEQAAKLGLAPSVIVLRRLYKRQAFTKFCEELGDASPRLKFQGASNEWCIEAGICLADKLGCRPSKDQMDEARGQGTFPGHYSIEQRFGGNLKIFYELIGRPNFNDADMYDYLDWAVAFKRQNGVDAVITAQLLTKYSKEGRGPSFKIVYKYFTNLEEFNKLATEEYLAQVAEEEEAICAQQDAIDRLSTNTDFTDLLETRRENKHFAIAAKYQLVKLFMPDTPPETLTWLVHRSAADVASLILERCEEETLGSIEIAAEALHIYDTLWPGYRFENANLKIAA